MKKILLLLIAICSIHIVNGCPVNPKPFEYIQPDGSKLILHARGDEYGTWIETEDNTIVVKGKDGFYEYATVSDSTIVASGFRYGKKTSHRAPSRNGRDQGPIGVGLPDKDSLMSVIGVMRRAAMEALNSTEEEIEDSLAGPKRAATSVKSVSPQPLVAKGTQRVLCILMQFQDVTYYEHFGKTRTQIRSDIDSLWNGKKGIAGNKGSVREYYEENSYGQLKLHADIYGPYTTKKNCAYYKYEGRGDTKSKVKELVREALEAVKKDGVKFQDYDSNGDYWVDAVHIVFAGYAIDGGGPSTSIYSHRGKCSAVAQTQGLTWSAKDYIVTSAFAGSFGNAIAPVGTICHEYGHILGAPDFYDADSILSGGKYPGTGYYDVMAAGQWNNSGRTPAHHNAFTKMFLFNWVSNPLLDMAMNQPAKMIMPTDNNKLYTLNSVHNTPDIYLMLSGGEDDLFILENKAQLGFNSAVPGTYGGLVIYHVHDKDIQKSIKNESINISHPMKCYVVNAQATTNPNSNPSSYGELLEYGIIPVDWAYPGRDGSKMFFTSNSIPSATSWNGDFAGANVCFIQRGSGYSINFVVNPQIVEDDNSTLTARRFTIHNVPLAAMIGNSAQIVGSDNASSVTIQPVASPKIGRIDQGISRIRNTVTLKATITSGGYSYVISKDVVISAGSFNPILRSAALTSSSESMNAGFEIEQETAKQIMPEENVTYRLVYANPVVNAADVRVEKLENGIYVPYEGKYTLSLRGERVAMTHQRAKGQPNCTFDCENIPMGVYQLVLQVEGKVVASSKMLKLM